MCQGVPAVIHCALNHGSWGKEEEVMNEVPVVKLGEIVPNFTLDAFFPTKKDFGKISLEQLGKDNKWTILFFYPADFTFV